MVSQIEQANVYLGEHFKDEVFSSWCISFGYSNQCYKKLYEMFLQFLVCVGNFFGSAQDSEWKDYQTGAKKGKESYCSAGPVGLCNWQSCYRIFFTNLSLQLRPHFYLLCLGCTTWGNWLDDCSITNENSSHRKFDKEKYWYLYTYQSQFR